MSYADTFIQAVHRAGGFGSLLGLLRANGSPWSEGTSFVVSSMTFKTVALCAFGLQVRFRNSVHLVSMCRAALKLN